MINPKLLNWDELGMVHCWIYYMIQPGMSSLGNAKLGPPHKIPSDGNIETPDIPTAYIYIHTYILYTYIYIYGSIFWIPRNSWNWRNSHAIILRDPSNVVTLGKSGLWIESPHASDFNLCVCAEANTMNKQNGKKQIVSWPWVNVINH